MSDLREGQTETQRHRGTEGQSSTMEGAAVAPEKFFYWSLVALQC